MGDLSQQTEAHDPVFVCGALRSGTTLLRLMIDAHPALSNPGEMDFLFEPPADGDGQVDMALYAHELTFNRVFKSCGLKMIDGLTHREQVREFAEQLNVPGRLLTINIHRHFDRVPAIFGGARFIHLLRDPRDVASSSIGMGWAGNVYHGVDHWIESEKSFDALAAKTPSERIFTLKNEDLIRSPETSLSRLCEFLGVAFDPAMLSYPAYTSYKSPNPKLVEQWRSNLSERDIALIEGKVGSLLADRGYAPSGLAPIAPNSAARFRLRQMNRFGRFKFSIKRNGVWLALASVLSRRLPFKTFRDRVRREITAREAEFLK